MPKIPSVVVSFDGWIVFLSAKYVFACWANQICSWSLVFFLTCWMEYKANYTAKTCSNVNEMALTTCKVRCCALACCSSARIVFCDCVQYLFYTFAKIYNWYTLSIYKSKLYSKKCINTNEMTLTTCKVRCCAITRCSSARIVFCDCE